LSLGHNTGRDPLDARRLSQTLAAYHTPSHPRSIAELAITFMPLAALWMAA
jgi:omega-6 fatty acid desaturase (delta-12 desaturase)